MSEQVNCPTCPQVKKWDDYYPTAIDQLADRLRERDVEIERLHKLLIQNNIEIDLEPYSEDSEIKEER